jgi:hypothetical protein
MWKGPDGVQYLVVFGGKRESKEFRAKPATPKEIEEAKLAYSHEVFMLNTS